MDNSLYFVSHHCIKKYFLPSVNAYIRAVNIILRFKIVRFDVEQNFVLHVVVLQFLLPISVNLRRYVRIRIYICNATCFGTALPLWNFNTTII